MGCGRTPSPGTNSAAYTLISVENDGWNMLASDVQEFMLLAAS